LREAQSKATDASQRAGLNRIEAIEHEWYSTFADRFIQEHKDVDSGKINASDLLEQYTKAEPMEQLRAPMKSSTRYRTPTAPSLTKIASRTKQPLPGPPSSASPDSCSPWAWVSLIAFRTAHNITEPLEHLITVAREVGDKGDLSQQVDIEGEDEIGTLAQTFRNMVIYFKEMANVSESIAGGDLSVEVSPRSSQRYSGSRLLADDRGLRTLVRSVRDAAAQVAAGSNQVADASEDSAKINVQSASAIDEVTSTMHEMSINVQNMVKNTQMQASSVSETSASIDEMVASIQRVADTAKVLLDISNRSRDEVQSGIGTMQKTTEGLNRINGSIGSSHPLSSPASASASITSARSSRSSTTSPSRPTCWRSTPPLKRPAPENTASASPWSPMRSASSLRNPPLHQGNQRTDQQHSECEARKAVDNMEKSTLIVNEGLLLGNDLSLALRKISNVVTEVFKFAQEIGAATNEQSHGSSQIAKATTRLNEITHEITSSVEEQAGGAQAVVRAMERMREMVQQSTSGSTELAASAEQMSKMARSLLESMDRFVLEEHAEERRGG
jgi:methyl-accepting chemotaxis protein